MNAIGELNEYIVENYLRILKDTERTNFNEYLKEYLNIFIYKLKVLKSFFTTRYKIKEVEIKPYIFNFFYIIDYSLKNKYGHPSCSFYEKEKALGCYSIISEFIIRAISERDKLFFKTFSKVINKYLEEDFFTSERSAVGESILFPKSSEIEIDGRITKLFFKFLKEGSPIRSIREYKGASNLSKVDSDTLRDRLKKLNIPRNTEAGRPKKAKE